MYVFRSNTYRKLHNRSAQLQGKIGVSDLISSLSTASESRKKLAKLMRSSDDLKIAAPLSRPAQERMDREVQYSDTKDRVSDWLPTVQARRRAEQLVFPLPENEGPVLKPSNNTLVRQFTPETDLERQIQSVLSTSGITEEKLAQFEALQERSLSPEEIKERHSQLAKMRSLFFFQEKKNKRMKKIKSKKYRKILRHSKEKGKPTLEELEELDPEAAKEERMKLEKMRAEERMTRKHKTTGKWAKHAAKSHDPQFKDALNDHLRRGQDLLRKMNSVKAASDDDEDASDFSNDSDADSEELEAEEQQIRASLRKESNKRPKVVSSRDGHLVDEDGVLIDSDVTAVVRPNAPATDDDMFVPSVDQDASYPTSGVLGMKFMKRAADKKRGEFNSLLQDMNQEDKQWQQKMERALRENEVSRVDAAEDDEDGDSGEALDSDDDADKRERAAEAARQKQRAEQKELEKMKKQHAVSADGGRQKFGVIGTQVSSTHQGAPASAADKKSTRKLEASGLGLESGRDGFEIGLSGPLSISVGADSGYEPMEFDDGLEESYKQPSGFNVNKVDVAGRLKRQEQQEKRPRAPRPTPSAAPRLAENDADDEATGNITLVPTAKSATTSRYAPHRGRPAQAANPWLQAAGDDDDDVAVGAAPTGKTSSHKKQLQASEQEKKAERQKQRKASPEVRLDLDKIREDLQQQGEDEPAFNLVAASNASRSQRELINRAFAADHITEDQLEAEKNADASAQNEVDAEMAEMLLPGWGDWAGPQVQPSRRRQRLLETLEKKKVARQQELLGKRQDSRMKHVVINEKLNKKFAKYEAADVPYPYKTRQEYEAALRQPLGKEWNTTLMHKAVIQPKVKVKRGKIIEPIRTKQQ